MSYRIGPKVLSTDNIVKGAQYYIKTGRGLSQDFELVTTTWVGDGGTLLFNVVSTGKTIKRTSIANVWHAVEQQDFPGMEEYL